MISKALNTSYLTSILQMPCVVLKRVLRTQPWNLKYKFRCCFPLAPIHSHTAVIQRGKVLREPCCAVELTLHARTTLPLCQPSSVLPAKPSSFLITEGKKTTLERCLPFPIIPYNKGKTLIVHTQFYFDKNVPLLKTSIRSDHKKISISHPPLRVLLTSLHTMKRDIKGSFCGLQQLKLSQANKSHLLCTWFPFGWTSEISP